MQPQTIINNAMQLAHSAIAKGGKPSAVKLKVKFDAGKKTNAVKRRARSIGNLSDNKGVTR